jgi:putative membrane protein
MVVMSERGETLLRAGILGAIGCLLYTKLLNGTLYFYVHQRFAWLMLAAASLFILLALVTADQTRRSAVDGACANPHGHHTGRVALFLVGLPVVLGLLVPPKPLGAPAMGNRELNPGTLVSARRGEARELLAPAEQGSILGWLMRFGADPDVEAFAGEEADVLGFVYRDDRFAQDQFMVARFAVFCCVADASPVGLIVRWPGAADLELDGWVQVRGRFGAGEFEGQTLPVLIAEEVLPAAQPSQPYVYP